MVFHTKKSILDLAEIWYDESESLNIKADVIKYRYVPREIPKSSSIEPLYTILIDLAKDNETLWGELDKTTKHQINRCQKQDPVESFTFLGVGDKNSEALKFYIDFFNVFAQSKGRGLIEYSDLAPFFESGTFVIRGARERESGTMLTMHAYVVCNGRARLHQSCSHFRNASEADFINMVGRSNRLLHWDDILYFKGTGCAIYDLGGWYGGQEDQSKLAINRFKEGFGGEKTPEYTCIKAVSPFGALSCVARKILKKKH